VLGVVGGSIAAWVASRRAPPGALDAAIARTIARYRGAPRADRHYVRWKLRLDPVLREIATLGELGDVVDAGSGRGQLGACLWELGLVRTLAGFDHDEHKVALARAAFPEASFSTESAETYAFPAADTILFIDVLHYLDSDAQDGVLERAASSLRPDGRLILREVEDARRGSALTRLFNRGQKVAFRPLSEIVERLAQLGFECERRDASSGTPLSNALVVANYRPRAAASMLKS
jgi:SAM-dependent methyltransferase